MILDQSLNVSIHIILRYMARRHPYANQPDQTQILFLSPSRLLGELKKKGNIPYERVLESSCEENKTGRKSPFPLT